VTARRRLLRWGSWFAVANAVLLGVVGLRYLWYYSALSPSLAWVYAVLAYVAQEAVATYHWLTAPEMIEGLALAETTPGPLILVLQHVGFLAAFRQAGITPLLAGILGAVLTLWVTFTPSFLWIFAGAPYAERVRENKSLSAALAAITAAVVGVMLNLAIWFALHVVFATVNEVAAGPLHLHVPEFSSVDIVALLLVSLSLIALLRFKVPMLALLGVSALLGLAAKFSGL